MAARDPKQVYRTPGRLVLNPSNLAGAFPYGGKELGTVGRVRLRCKKQGVALMDWSNGQLAGSVPGSERWSLRWDFLQRDQDSYGLLFSYSGTSIRQSNAGPPRSNPGPLLFVPWDVLKHDSCLVFNPSCWPAGDTDHDSRAIRRVPVEGWAAQDVNGHVVQIDLLANLSLT